MPTVFSAMRLNWIGPVKLFTPVSVGLDPIGVLQVVAAENAGSGHARGVVVDVLVLHLAGKLHAGDVAENLIRLSHADKTKTVDAAGHRGDHAGGVAVDAIGAQARPLRRRKHRRCRRERRFARSIPKNAAEITRPVPLPPS